MAQFEGSVSEFTKFIGAYCRIKVMHLTSKFKKNSGKCEECGISKALHAAHIRGKERPILIAKILSEYIEGSLIRIDLNEFEQRFIDAHLPLESTIRILCKDCHLIYDKVIKENIPLNLKTSEKQTVDEGVIIERLINNQMNKSKAMQIAKSANLTSITNANTIFSNINAAADCWWLEPHNTKFQSELFIILNDEPSKRLYVLKLPANSIPVPEKYFIQRNDKSRTNCSDIYIPVSGVRFLDKKGFDFTEFLEKKLQYS